VNKTEIDVWIQIGTLLLNAGLVISGGIQSLIHSVHPGATEGQLNAILDGIIADATVRKARADAEAAGK
jgi:hypothetical protein